MNLALNIIFILYSIRIVTTATAAHFNNEHTQWQMHRIAERHR